MGLIAGLLGIGGGANAVPLQHMVLRLPFRTCIANSSAVICVTATLGAVYKNATLGQHGYDWHESLALGWLLAPSCWLGGYLGARPDTSPACSAGSDCLYWFDVCCSCQNGCDFLGVFCLIERLKSRLIKVFTRFIGWFWYIFCGRV